MSSVQQMPRVPLVELLREPLRNGHSAKASGTDQGIPTLTLSAVTNGDFSERNVKATVAEPEKVRDLWLEPGDILVERSNTPELVGTARLYRGLPNYAIFPDLLIRVRLNDRADERFIEAFLQSPEARRYFQRSAQGIAGSMPKISQGTIEALEVPLPPKPQQIALVDEIEKHLTRIDAGVAALERVQANLKRYRASVLKAACEGRLVPTEAEFARKERRDYEPAAVLLNHILVERRKRWEEAELAKLKAKGKPPGDSSWKKKYEEPKPPDTSELPELPEGWCWATLKQLTTLVTSGSRGWGDRYAEDGPLFIRAQDIKTDRLRLEDVAHVDIGATTEGARTRVFRGDLLVTITGANVTKTARVDVELPEAYVSQHVGLVRPVRAELVPYVYDWVIAPAHGRGALERLAYGAGKPGLNLDNLRELDLALPPRADQARIVAEVERRLSVADELGSTLATSLARAQRLRQSILKAAFEGKLVRSEGPAATQTPVRSHRGHASRKLALPLGEDA